MVLSTPIRSLSEFLKLPETKPASEYIDGVIVQKPMPQGKHSTLQIALASQINLRGEPQHSAYAFPELRCTFGGRSIVPDISVFNWERIPLDENGEVLNRIEIVPDWAIEILSPEQPTTRPMDNLLFCIRQGTSLGWLIDPQERLVFVFQRDRLPETRTGDDRLCVLPAIAEWELTVNHLFHWLRFG